MKNLLIDIERVGDMAEDIAEFAQERVRDDVTFAEDSIQELDTLWHRAHSIYDRSLEAFRDGNKELAHKVCKAESEFDILYWKTRQLHIDRLEAGLAYPEADVIFTETLRLLERISDHADNLGVSVSRS